MRNIRRVVALLGGSGLFLLAVVALVISVPGTSKAAGQTLGTLKIQVSGLPGKAKPTIAVSGPSVKRTVSGKTTLRELVVGKYTARGRDYYTSTAKYVPLKPASTKLGVGKTGVLEIKYRVASRTATLSLKLERGPQGQRSTVVIRGPRGFKKKINATTTLKGLKPGSYSIEGDEVPSGELIYLPGVTNPTPLLLPGETTKITVSWNSAKNRNLVVLDQTNVVQAPVGGSGVLTVADPSGLDVGDPVVVPEGDATPQTVVRVVSIDGNQISVEPSSIYEALPIVDYEYADPAVTDGDVAASSVSKAASNPFGTLKFECESLNTTLESESAGFFDIVGKLSPFIRVKSAAFKWDLTSKDVFEGPEKVELIVTSGLTREAIFDLGLTLSKRCAGTVRQSTPLPSLGPIPMFLRGELGVEGLVKSTYMIATKATSITTFSYDMGMTWDSDGIKPVLQPGLSVGFQGSEATDWNPIGDLSAEIGVFGNLFVSPFNEPKKKEFLNIEVEYDLKVGFETRLGAGIQARIENTPPKNASAIKLTITPYRYRDLKLAFTAEAKGTVNLLFKKVSKGFSIRKSLDMGSTREDITNLRFERSFGIKKVSTPPSVTTIPKGVATTVPRGSTSSIPKKDSTTTTSSPTSSTLPVSTDPDSQLSGCSSNLVLDGDTACSPAMAVGDSWSRTLSVQEGTRFTVGGYRPSFDSTLDYIRVYRPDGTQYSYNYFGLYSPRVRVDVKADVSGLWRISYVNSARRREAEAVKIEVTSVSSQTITPGNTSLSSPALRMGGVASYKVTASNGSRFTVGAYKSGSDLDYIRVYRPDGTEYSYDSFGYVPYGRVSVAADMTGTWRIDVINSDGSSPSWQESVGAFTVDVAWVTTQSITPGNTTISSPALRMGGLAVYTFSATQGERLTVGAYKNGGGNDRISIIRPDGSEYGSDTFYSSDPYGHVSILPDVSGTWMIFLGNTDGASASWQEAAGAFTFDLATVSTQSITPGNTTISSPALRMGGRAVYTFSATQGERLTVGAYKNGGGSDIIWVIRPDGSEYGRDTFYSSDPYGHVSILPDVSGTWMIYLANTDGASASWQEAAGAFTFTLRPT